MEDNRLIGIRGKIGAGKDTVAKLILQYSVRDLVTGGNAPEDIGILEEYSCWEIKKFATKVKQIAYLLTGYSITKFEDQEFKKQKLGQEWNDMTAREMMIKIGTECMRDNLHPDTWVNALFVDYIQPYQQDWIITDLRFKNELERIRKYNGINLSQPCVQPF